MIEMDRIARADIERLSAFLDGELSPREAEQLEARLATDQELSSALAALRATAEVVGSLPEVRLPRSFALTQDMVRPRRAYPFLQFSTAAAALGFVLVIGADLLFGGAPDLSMGASSEQLPFVADQLADSAAAPALEEGKPEEAESELALPEAESVGEAEDGLAQGLFRSDDQAAGAELVEESAAAPAAGGPPAEGAAEPGESEFADESLADLEALSEADQDALKAAAEEGRLTAAELELPDKQPLVSLNLFRMIEIGFAAAFVILIGLTLWVRQRG
jgi:hypothetical protein